MPTSRHASEDDDETRELHPVAADEPIVMRQPRRQVRRIATAYAAAIIICSGMAAWIATDISHERASDHTDRQLRVLNEDLNTRRRAAAAANARRDAQTAELVALVCVLLDRAQPRDAAVEAFRQKYGCVGGRPALPSPTVTPPVPTPIRTRTGGSGGGRPDATTRAPPRMPRSPTPPAPSRSPQVPDSLLCLAVPPLLPEFCL